jgi:hypothetical protein
MKKLYYLLFYKLYRFWKTVSDDNWSDWKSSLVISCIEMLLIIELIIWWTIATKIIIEVPKVLLAVIAILITIVNNNIFFSNDRWRNYEIKFKSYSKQKSKIAGWLVFLFLIGVLGSFIFSFYQMSLIDWSRYR